VGAVAAQLAIGKPIRDAFDYANTAASICVQRLGAAPSMPIAAEVAANTSTGRPREGGDP
jgi:ribokinase